MHRLKATQSLSDESIERYSRQLLLPEVGVQGMKGVQAASVLIVGAGGLGCPVSMYLATAGIGKIGIVEYDTVEISNLHRQIGHRETTVGQSKAESLVATLKLLNSSITYEAFEVVMRKDNAKEIAQKYDVVVDASDNVATRYLLNDLCVLLKKPLVSGSALRWEGQLTVYNYESGPCYRCVFPKPPPAETVTNCSDGGLVGPVTGVIGSMQALEALKIILGQSEGVAAGLLVMFDGLSGKCRSLRLRNRDPKCEVCGDHPTVTDLIDYETFCGSSACDKAPSLTLLQRHDRLSAQEFRRWLVENPSLDVVDIRPRDEYNLAHIPDSVNVPFEELESNSSSFPNELANAIIVCRRGNDSQKAVEILKQRGISTKDVIGGIVAWRQLPDVSFPIY